MYTYIFVCKVTKCPLHICEYILTVLCGVPVDWWVGRWVGEWVDGIEVDTSRACSNCTYVPHTLYTLSRALAHIFIASVSVCVYELHINVSSKCI